MDRLAEKTILISDGAWGTMLQAAGLTAGECPEQWNLRHPERVKAVATAYERAGSDMVLTNTFGGSEVKLEQSNLRDKLVEVNRVGAELSLAGVTNAVVAASVGSTGQFIQPLGLISEDEMEGVFSRQIAALLAGGVRAICVESMTAVEEACCVVRAAKELDASVDVAATMTFDPVPDGFRTMMGVDVATAAQRLAAAGADILGSNCGNGIEQMVDIAAEFRRHTDLPILIHANAGVPELIDGQTVFRESPQDMAACVKDLLDAGANIIGGCCGTTPEHIVAIRAEVDKAMASRSSGAAM